MRTLDIAVCDDDISTLELISSSIAAAFGKKGVATQMDTFFQPAVCGGVWKPGSMICCSWTFKCRWRTVSS